MGRKPGADAGTDAGTDTDAGADRGAGARTAPEQAAARTLEQAFREAELTWESPAAGTYVVQLPGTRKLSTTCQFIVGRHTVSLNAFVVRHPDENQEAFYRWLLERNLRTYGVSYAVDRLGDVYLSGRLPLAAVTVEEIDRLLGAVLENADGSFNTLLELGFATAIRKEYAWRVARGEPTRNLEAFSHLTGDQF
ncbi:MULTISPECIES: YbjN domain-containing protein [unclassified Streptomyces]|uniref:YbjN domain-containing protein n=1 Tax=unclassified Streptomyces TaxID=2593676 RepID=UPI002351A003|nr:MULTISPECIES: YbjN domain-containing protein [unclassified Streptomyces]